MEKSSLFLILVLVLVILGLIYTIVRVAKRYIKPVDRWDLQVTVPPYFKDQDRLIQHLGQKSALSNSDYEAIFKYFLLGSVDNSHRQPEKCASQ